MTLCSRNRKEMFGNIVGGDVLIAPKTELSCIGRTIQNVIETIPAIKKYVIMPNHIHFIVEINGEGSMSTSTPTQGLPSLVRYLKRTVSIQCGETVWQRNYYEHIIRNKEDYLSIWTYIDTNPARWQEDEYCEG